MALLPEQILADEIATVGIATIEIVCVKEVEPTPLVANKVMEYVPGDG